MMREEEDEETLFDQQGLLGTGKRSSWDWEWVRRFTKTLALSLAFFALGLCVSIPGATLPDLESEQTPAQNASPSSSQLQILLFYTLVFTGIATIAVPWCTALASLAGMIAVQGLALGILDTGGNMFCIKIWSKSSPPYMQALHFAFAVGAFLAPLLARPFLGAGGALIANNTAYSISHVPVNTHMPDFSGSSIHSDEQGGARRLTRDVDRWWLADGEHYRVLRDAASGTEGEGGGPSINGTAKPNSNLTDNLNGSSSVVSVSPTTTVTSARPPKPGVADGKHLPKGTADGGTIKDRLLEHKDDERPEDSNTQGDKEAPTSTESTTAQNNTVCFLNGTVVDNSLLEGGNLSVGLEEKLVNCSQPRQSDVAGNGTIGQAQIVTEVIHDALDIVRNMSKIQFAYMIVGLFLLCDATFFLVLYCRDCRAGTLLHQVLALGPSMAPASPCFRISILALLFSFFLIYVGMEVTFGGLLTTFAVDSDLQWTRPQGATLAALFWGSIAVGRGMSIFIARWFKPPCMLVTDLVFVISGAVLLSFGLQASPIILWVGTVILGLGMSSVFPAAVSWADCYYPLTGRAAAVFIAGSGVGEMVIPVVTGYLFEKVDNMWLMYVVLGLSGLLTFVYTCLQCIASRSPAPTSVSKLGFMPLQNEDENNIAMYSMDEEDGVVNGSAGYTETTHRRKPPVSNHVEDVEETTKLVDLSD
ncbi:hypothetical protein BaRGS_00026870 [Batillaria attramentaria]|uniref:Uncharacterized protein n=1 Tax=Batillaria attramentaria TaxID=370345 RepID=A0ABD0K461_9CAEN